jgi:putative intracellular protease/amidase
MAGKGKVDWYAEDVILKLEQTTRRGLEALAAYIEGQAKIQIVENDQVDTGFMVNSVYHAAADAGSTYAAANGTGEYVNKAGESVNRELAPEADLPAEYDALVCVGANYAIYQEMAQPFLYPALLRGAAAAKAIIETKAKEDGLHA